MTNKKIGTTMSKEYNPDKIQKMVEKYLEIKDPDSRDIELAGQILEECEPIVEKLVSRYPDTINGENIDKENLIGDANMLIWDLLQEEYDPTQTAKFSTFIYGRIRQYFFETFTQGTIKISSATLKNIKRLNEAEEEFYKENGRVPTDEELRKYAGMWESTLKETIKAKSAMNVESLDKLYGSGGDEFSLAEKIADEKNDIDMLYEDDNEQELLLQLREKIEKVYTEKEKEILRVIYNNPHISDEDIAKEIGRTTVYVRQVRSRIERRGDKEKLNSGLN